MITFPLWFKIFLAWFALLIITGSIRFLSKGKIVDSINNLPDDKKDKLVKSYSMVLKVYKILIWTMPLYLVLIPYVVYIFVPKNFFHVAVINSMVCVLIVEDFFYRKWVVSSIMEHNKAAASDR